MCTYYELCFLNSRSKHLHFCVAYISRINSYNTYSWENPKRTFWSAMSMIYVISFIIFLLRVILLGLECVSSHFAFQSSANVGFDMWLSP